MVYPSSLNVSAVLLVGFIIPVDLLQSDDEYDVVEADMPPMLRGVCQRSVWWPCVISIAWNR